MKIFGYHVKDSVFYRSDGLIRDTDVFEWLLNNPRDQINIAAHLDYFASVLLRSLNEAQLWELNTKGETKSSNMIIRYVPQKFLSLVQEDKFFLISDANQYDYYSFNKELNGIEGTKHATKTGVNIYNALVQLGLHPKNLISPIRVWEKEHKLNLPKVDDIPALATELSYKCCQGNWLEVFKKGHFQKVYDYDVRSCFASIASDLLDTRYGEWIESNKYQPEADYGYVEGEITVFPNFEFSPIFFKKNRENYATSGFWQTALNKSKLDYLIRHKRGQFRIQRGVWWKSHKKVYPLKAHIAELYQKKELSEGYKRDAAKRILNGGFYGKFIQLNQDKEFGDSFNSVFAAEIESQSAVKVAETCIRNKVKPISIAVDGVITEQKINDRDFKRLGDWKLSAECSALAISSGVVALQDHKTLKDFSLDYDWLMNEIKQNPKESQYSRKKLSPVTLAKACNENRLKDLGNLEEITQTINIMREVKRGYVEVPHNGEELLNRVYDSIPLDVSTISRLRESEN